MSNLLLFAQDDAAVAAGAGIAFMLMMLVLFALSIVIIIGQWKVFEKAGKPGWASIIPIYNAIVFLEIVGKPIWWILLLLIPCVGWVVGVILCIELAKCFGKDTGYGLGIAFLSPIFIPMLGFGSAQYTAPPPPA